MATDAILSLNDLICLKESDGTGHSEPYIWPVLVWIDDSFEVHLAAPALGNARVVIKNDMRAGETAALPASVGVLRFRFEDAANIRGEATIEIINARVRARVESSIRGALTTGEKIRVAAGTLNLDDVVGSDFKNLPDLASAPISLTFAGVTRAGGCCSIGTPRWTGRCIWRRRRRLAWVAGRSSSSSSPGTTARSTPSINLRLHPKAT